MREDSTINPELQEQVEGIQGEIVSAAEKQDLPDRFKVTRVPDRPYMTVIDTKTNRQTTVALCHYSGVRQSLNDLFGELE